MCIKTESQLTNCKAWPWRCTWCASQRWYCWLATEPQGFGGLNKVQYISQIESGHISGLFFILSFILELINTKVLCPSEESDTRTTFKSSLPSKGEAGGGRKGWTTLYWCASEKVAWPCPQGRFEALTHYATLPCCISWRQRWWI